MEILSPVGSKDALIAAVRAGCDAVYLGAKSFSARRNAANFDRDELLEAVKYCHRSRVKVYVTVNISIKDSEMAEAMKLIDDLNNCGVDGLIVQDLGLARLINQFYPQLPLHGSTQMSVQSPAALVYLWRHGFRRIVVAREMSATQLKQFCLKARELDMEVECFVHGALCMSVSGQCLLSSMIGQRSGNRGLCAQPCRLPFKVQSGTGYDLSLKDLSLFRHLKELGQMGVASLKIEGRMKRPEYVALATYCCRKALENDFEYEGLLRGVFSRSGFTDGYFTANRGRQMFGTRTIEDVKASQNSFNRIHELYRSERQSVALDMSFKARKTEPLKLSCEGIEIEDSVPEIAQSKPTTEQDIRKNLAKLGNTPYYMRDFTCEMDDDLFIAASTVNNMRRKLIEKLDEKAQTIEKRISYPIVYSNDPAKRTFRSRIVRIADKSQYYPQMDCDELIIPVDMDSRLVDKPVIVEIPRWIDSEEYLRLQLKKQKDNGVRMCYCNSLAAIELARECGMAIMAGNFMNVYNSESVRVLEEYGCSRTTASVELTLNDIKELKSSSDLGIIGYGRIPLMLLRNCPLKNGRSCDQCDRKGYIEDRTNTRFPIRCLNGTSELLNSAPIYLADKLEDVQNVSFMIYYFTIESAQQIAEVLDDYRNRKKAGYSFTRGLYYRGVL